MFARFPYFRSLPTVSLAFASNGAANEAVRRLLVDSGFTGRSSLILSHADCDSFCQRVESASEVGGAIQGSHPRAWVSCAIHEISFRADLLAIAADISTLSLPLRIDGLAGLSFLNQFTRWGAERDATGGWEFVLEK